MLFNEETVDSYERNVKVDIMIRIITYISAQNIPNCVYIAYSIACFTEFGSHALLGGLSTLLGSWHSFFFLF